MDAIRDFPTLTSTTDIRSWFGHANQVANYAQLRDIIAPFKPFLSPRCRFEWTPEHEKPSKPLKNLSSQRSAVVSKSATQRNEPAYAQIGPVKASIIGYFLSQKHCSCDSCLPDCCTGSWRVTLAASRFLTSAEQRYAPIEGEALDVDWGLGQSKYFTQGCNDLLVTTDHTPLAKILGDRTLAEISNIRIFRLKQRTVPWPFDVASGQTQLSCRCYVSPPVTSQRVCRSKEYIASLGNGRR